jgi:serine protease Do
MVVSLASGAPAEAAGVLPGDIVLDLNGETVGRVRTLAGLLGADRIGQTLQLRVLRAGAIHVVAVTIVERPTR